MSISACQSPAEAPGLSFATGAIDSGTNGVALSDFNGDHHLDIAFHSTVQADRSNGERFMVLLGNGTFDDPLITQPGLPVIEQLRSFDFNGDGHTDIIAVGYTGGFYILLGRGDATFDAPTSCWRRSTARSTAAALPRPRRKSEDGYHARQAGTAERGPPAR